MITRHIPRLLLPLAILLAPALAHAGVTTGVDFDLGAPLGAHLVDYSASLGARVGYRFDLGPVWIQPEAGASFTSFKEGPMSVGLDVPRILGGARFGLGLSRVVQPAVFGHGGVGWYSNEVAGPAGAAGLAIDFALVPRFSFGAQVSYNILTAQERSMSLVTTGTGSLPVTMTTPLSIQWIAAGVHGGFTF